MNPPDEQNIEKDADVEVEDETSSEGMPGVNSAYYESRDTCNLDPKTVEAKLFAAMNQLQASQKHSFDQLCSAMTDFIKEQRRNRNEPEYQNRSEHDQNPGTSFPHTNLKGKQKVEFEFFGKLHQSEMTPELINLEKLYRNIKIVVEENGRQIEEQKDSDIIQYFRMRNKFPTFDGKNPMTSSYMHLKNYIQVCNSLFMSFRQMLSFFGETLKGEAAFWYRKNILTAEDPTAGTNLKVWRRTQANFMRRYSAERSQEIAQRMIDTEKYDPLKESVYEYSIRLSNLFDALGIPVAEYIKVRKFKNSIPTELRARIAALPIYKLSDVEKFAEQIEDCTDSARRMDQIEQVGNTLTELLRQLNSTNKKYKLSKLDSTDETKNQRQNNSQRSNTNYNQNFNNNRSNNFQSKFNQNNRNFNNQRNSNDQRNFNQQGQQYENRTSTSGTQQHNQNVGRFGNRTQTGFNANVKGNRNNYERINIIGTGPHPSIRILLNSAWVDSSSTMWVTARMSESSNHYQCLVDTGTQSNLIRADVAQNENLVIVPCSKMLTDFSGQQDVAPIGQCTAKVCVGKIKAPIQFLVVEEISSEIILGSDVLKTFGLTLDYSNKALERMVQQTDTYSNKSSMLGKEDNKPSRVNQIVTDYGSENATNDDESDNEEDRENHELIDQAIDELEEQLECLRHDNDTRNIDIEYSDSDTESDDSYESEDEQSEDEKNDEDNFEKNDTDYEEIDSTEDNQVDNDISSLNDVNISSLFDEDEYSIIDY